MSVMKIRFFTISDYEEEEIWLRDMHRQGLKLDHMVIPCFYFFSECEPEDVIYRLDFKNNQETPEYLQIFRDYGWEDFERCAGWVYFRKPASQVSSETDGEIFSDGASKVEMVEHVVRLRILPLVCIFLCCVIPNLTRTFYGHDTLSVFFGIMFVIYMYIFIHCGLKLRKLKKKYSGE